MPTAPTKKEPTPPRVPRSRAPRHVAVALVTAAALALLTRLVVAVTEGPAPLALEGASRAASTYRRPP